MELLTDKKSKMKVRDRRSSCPVSTSLEIIGDSWSLVLIRDLFLEKKTFTDFINSPENISTNILSNRINKLLKYKLIEYRLHPKNRKVKQYYLTESGVKLYPLIYDLSMWSKEHLDMEFDQITVDWYKENEGKNRDETIYEANSSYNKFKTKLLI